MVALYRSAVNDLKQTASMEWIVEETEEIFGALCSTDY